MTALIPRSLDAHAFAPFGEVVSFDYANARLVNNGKAFRSDLRAGLKFFAGEPKLSVYRVEAQRSPVTIVELERHPNSSQTFVPITTARFVVVVAPDNLDGSPDLSGCRAFVGERAQGFNYRPGVWHAPIVALDQGGDFLMLIWEQGDEADCRTERLALPIQILSSPD